MNYNKNIPDWQQYNALQSGGSEGAAANMAAPPSGQNVNPNGSFVSSPSSMNSMNPDCLNKSQTYAAHSNGSNGFMGQSPLTPIMHISNCMSHYGNSSNVNPMMEEMNNDVDSHSNAMTMNGPVNHMVNSNMNMNNNLVQGSRFPPNNSMTSNNRQSSFISNPCKGPCCIDPNMNYGYGSYSHTAPYRENMHAPNYNADDRRYMSSGSRKESYSGKAGSSNSQYHVDQRRNRADYKYQKSASISRNCHQSSVMLSPNCGVQNYNMPTDYMKYHYPSRGPIMPNATMPNPPSGMIKFHDMAKHQYQNNSMMPNVGPNNNVSAMQNPFYNQMNCRDFNNENRERMEPYNTRLQPPSGPYAKHQIYRQKFAIQRFTLENQLKEMSRMPGYLSNPKYQECVLRYRELLNLQRTVEFQSSIQESSMNANANARVRPPISPINLQFDHNGILIHSNYLSTNYSGTCNQTNNSNTHSSSAEHQQNVPMIDQQSGQQIPSNVSQETNVASSSDQQTEFRVPQEVQQNKTSRDFADKPTLDVREFLATWNESEEVENQAVINALVKENTPITVVKLADINLVTNLAEGQKELSVLQSPSTAIQGNGTVDINKVVGVLNCITSNGSEVPTLHIVDNLENKIVVEKIDSALNEINNVNIKCIQDIMNKEHSAGINVTKQVESSSQDTISDTSNGTGTVTAIPAQKTVSESSADPKKDSRTLELSNPDDLSLPELSTFECIATSTSLNTPTHSDSEETLEQVTQLRMSANPIEVVQNSPIISFAQSTEEGDKNGGKSVSVTEFNPAEVIDNFLDPNRSKESQSLSLPTVINEPGTSFKTDNKITKKLVDGPNVCDKIMEQFCESSYSNSANVPLIPGDENEELRIPVPPMEDNCLTRIMKNTPPITNISVLNSDSEREEEDIWLQETNIDKNLESDLNDLHHLSKDNQISTRKLKKLLKHKSQSKKKVDLKKIKHLFKNDLRQVNISEMINLLFKSDDDSSSSVQSTDNSCESKRRRRGSNEYAKDLHEKPRISSKHSKERKLRSKSVEPIIDSSETDSLEEYKKLKRKRSIGSSMGTNENEKKCQLLTTSTSEDESKIVKYDSKNARNDYEFELQSLKNKVRKDAGDGGIKIEINLSCSDKNLSTKLSTGENKLTDTNSTVSQCDKKLYSKLSNEVAKNINLPQTIDKAEISKRNEFLPPNFSECLTTINRDKGENSSKDPSCSKPTITNVDMVEITEQLNLFNKTLHSKYRDKFYNPKSFDYSKDIYNMKGPKIVSSLNVDPILTKPVMELDCPEPCSSLKHRLFEKMTYFDGTDSLSRMNPLAFKNYATDSSFYNTFDRPSFESPNGFFNPTFLDDINKMNTVPIYTTRDGKIKYSPNRKYTYNILFKESEKCHDNLDGHKHHLKPRNRKRHKNKHDGKLHKSKDDIDHKQNSQKLKSLQKTEDSVRDCVIATASSNSTAEVTSIEDNQIENKNDSTRLDLKNTTASFCEPVEVQKETCNIIENRSTVIKQLGVVPNLNSQEEVKKTDVDTTACTSVICKDNSKDRFCQTSGENAFATSVLMHSKSIKSSPLPTILENKNAVDQFDNVNDVTTLNITDKKTFRRHSTSEMDQNILNDVKKSRRNSFESDIIITSIFHDIEHDLRDDVKQKDDILGKDSTEAGEENSIRDVNKYEDSTIVLKNSPRGVSTNDQIIDTESEFSDVEKNDDGNLKDVNILRAPLEVSENSPILSNNESIRNEQAFSDLKIISNEKIESHQEKTSRSPIYLEYEHVIIKEEQEEVVDKELPPDLDDELPELDKEDEIPPLEKSNLDELLTNEHSDNESVECPKLESQIEIKLKDKNTKGNKNELESIWFENKFANETFKSTLSSTVNCMNSSAESKFNKVNSPAKEKIIPKLVIRKGESIYSRPTSSVIKDDKSNFSKIPKIPKMIIRNTSRPGTPFGEASRSSSAESWSTKSLISSADDDTKIPKMKINLENDLPKVVIENIDIQTVQQTVPKMKIKKVKKENSESREEDKLQAISRERIPKLKLRKDSNSSRKRERSDSGKRSGSACSQSSKRSRKFSKDQEEMTVSEYECNTNDISVSDKIPKVIIKRTSTRSEFKCELSKSKKSAMEWQPRVTLNRSWILDTMAREFRHMKVALKLTTSKNLERLYDQNDIDPNKLKWDNFLSDLKKQKTVQSSSSEMISFDITTSTSRKKRNFLSIKEYSDSEESLLDENMNSRDQDEIVPRKKIRNFKISNGKNEYISDDACFENIGSRKLEKISSQAPSLCPAISQVEIDDSCTKISTSSVRKRSSGSIKEVERIIEVESSDESQTTIEILPATPDNSEEKEKIVSDEDISPLQFEVTSFKSVFPSDLTSPTDGHRSNMENQGKEEKRRSKKHSLSRSRHSSSRHGSSSHIKEDYKKNRQSKNSKLNDILSYSDLLAKEVLAAKETLKLCFNRCKDNSLYNIKPKNIVEDMQHHSNIRIIENSRSSSENEHNERLQIQSRPRSRSRSESASRTISLKQMKNATKGKKGPNHTTADLTKKLVPSQSNNSEVIDLVKKTFQTKREETNRRKEKEESNKKSMKEDKMPILEPQVDVNFTPSPDREVSRSPPIITSQETIDTPSSPKEEHLKLDSFVDESNLKSKKSKLDSDVTVAEIVRDLAFHEKATIKHSRYCTLCERWFPSVERHERHLSGYQHRHMELTQRRTIHALYTLFTGKLCPKLTAADKIRKDYTLGEPTPLQIVVQDIVVDCPKECSEKKKKGNI